ncbi:hypothetical protein SMICM17S_12735 [Streptomyces microflavus]
MEVTRLHRLEPGIGEGLVLLEREVLKNHHHGWSWKAFPLEVLRIRCGQVLSGLVVVDGTAHRPTTGTRASGNSAEAEYAYQTVGLGGRQLTQAGVVRRVVDRRRTVELQSADFFAAKS